MGISQYIKSATVGMPHILTGGEPGFRAGEERLAWNRPELQARDVISVRSDAFEDNGAIPKKYSVDGENLSPPLSWSNVPQEAGSIALVVEDPDAPTPNPFVHWLLYDVPRDVRQLPEGLPPKERLDTLGGAMQGKNSNLKIGWTGMAPPKGDTPHHYHFQLFALNRELPLGPGAGRKALLEAMAGHVVARGRIIGTYQR